MAVVIFCYNATIIFLFLEELARIGGGFHYEILCDIGKRVPRVYIEAGKVVGKKDYFDDIYEGFGK